MFGLLKGLYEHLTAKPTYRILVVGLEGSGKTVSVGDEEYVIGIDIPESV